MTQVTPPLYWLADLWSPERLKTVAGRVRRWDNDHRLWTDVAGASLLGALCLGVSRPSGPSGLTATYLQLALVAPLAWRRRAPLVVFATIALVALVQWQISVPLPADVALLVALFTVAERESTIRAVWAAGVLEVGAVMASIRWPLAGYFSKSWLFLTGMVFAALFAGITLRTWRAYHASLIERATRLEFERDQQSQLAAAAERSRIAREMHDVVAHNMAIMVTLTDAARTVVHSHPAQAEETLGEVSATGRLALTDMRRLLGVLRTESAPDRSPQPDIAGIAALVSRVRSTGLAVELVQEGEPFDVPSAVGLAVYRIVQESLTNVLKHADQPSRTSVTLHFDAPRIDLSIRDDGKGNRSVGLGHGVIGMRERAAVCGGELIVGPHRDGGWEVSTFVQADPVPLTA